MQFPRVLTGFEHDGYACPEVQQDQTAAGIYDVVEAQKRLILVESAMNLALWETISSRSFVNHRTRV